MSDEKGETVDNWPQRFIDFAKRRALKNGVNLNLQICPDDETRVSLFSSETGQEMVRLVISEKKEYHRS
jgi:hypothetical protein